MFRTIAAAAVVFGCAAFALAHSKIAGSFAEPVLLLLMGTLFLIAGRLFSVSGKKALPLPAAQLVERRAA
jgi:hypothetical protein